MQLDQDKWNQEKEGLKGEAEKKVKLLEKQIRLIKENRINNKRLIDNIRLE